MRLKESPVFSELYDKKVPNFRTDTFLTSWSSWNKEIDNLSLEGIFKREGFVVKPSISEEARKLIGFYEDPKIEGEIKVYFDAYLDEDTGVLLCLSNANQKEIGGTLDKAVKSPGIYYLWMSPNSMWKIKEKVMNEYPYSKITRFWTNKPKKMSTGKIRSDFKRSFSYTGDDGSETLEELNYDYGTYPTSIEFDIPETFKFSVNNNGYYRCMAGKNHFLDFLEGLLEIPLRDRGIISESSFETVKVSIDGTEYKIPRLKSWAINFSDNLTYKDGEIITEKLTSNNFTLVNSEMGEGSVMLDATVVDDEELDIFSISASENQLVVAPQEKCSFESFYRFLRIITENLDPEAECSIVEA